jgi:hypothetical protein
LTLRRCLTLYLGLPVMLALFNGIQGSTWAPELGMLKSIFMFLACGIPTYGFAALIAHSVLRLKTIIRFNPIIALIVSAIATVPFSYFVVAMFVRLFGAFYPSLQPLLHESGFGIGDGLLIYMTGTTGILIGPIWIGAQYLYERISGDVLFFEGHLKERQLNQNNETDPEARDINLDALPFLNKIKPDVGRNILALEAQEHYVKVYTDRGDDLVLYRMGDAVQELSQVQAGLRVHRSYWVAERAVTEILPAKNTHRLKLSNGLEVPVSNSYKKVVEQFLVLNPNMSVKI